MFVLMIFLSVCFILGVCFCAYFFFEQYQQQSQQEICALQEETRGLKQQKKELLDQKEWTDKKNLNIFTLYDMTKEINKKFSDQEAFEIFRKTLQENISFDDCRLIHAQGDRRKQIPQEKDYQIFSIKGGRNDLGLIAIKGLEQADHDKFTILLNQFILALQRVTLYQEVERKAITDSLTGMHTRRYVLERLEEDIARASIKENPLSFLMIDVDHFKSVNDHYGHLAGDQILRGISALIQENVREIDYVGRYGGEEFCVVLPDTDCEGGFFVAQRIRQAVEEACLQVYDITLQATVSLGIASFPKDGGNSTELIDKADWALYRSKKRGRNCVTAFGIYKS